MRALPRVLALLLLALWLPATLHCHLEAVGLFTDACAEHGADESSGPNDGCDLVEDAFYKSTSVPLKLAAPALLACLFLPPAETDAVSPPLPIPARNSEPQVLRCTWQFLLRAAPPCRAPSVLA